MRFTILALLMLPSVTAAQRVTMQVTTQAINACTIQTQNLDFGHYSASTATPTTGSGRLTMQCNQGVVAQLRFSNYSGKLRFGTQSLNYRLTFMRPNGTSVTPAPLVSPPIGTITGRIAFNGTPQVYAITGQIPPRQWSAPAGYYAETITLLLDY